HGKEILVLAMCYTGAIEEGERVTQPIRSYGKPLADVVAPQPFVAWQTALDPLLAPGMRNYWKSHSFMRLEDGLLKVLEAGTRRLPDPQTDFVMIHLGGAVSRVASGATAYTQREVPFVMNVHGRWADPAQDDDCIGWTREFFKATQPFATGGAYVNFLNQDDDDRIQTVYGSNYARLAELKRKMDPRNLFSMNHNIRPAS
ncbi:MAG TPA: BBE domain-containing protein, partial [Candidatus Eisenbacteria bacterium]|nr:BBE domain-containing protein [Candidatus Eisenbacteria bacterium]